jgi:alkyldihydroxyacetonephosphate synthase
MMKWWGWGREDFEFPMAGKPRLWPWIRSKIGVTDEQVPPVGIESIRLPEAVIHSGFVESVRARFKSNQLSVTAQDRILHSYGKSFPDLYRARRGEFARPPDAVVYPESGAEVEFLVREAVRCDVVLIPFGGGTNIVGSLTPPETERRMVVSVDLSRLNRLLDLDPVSRLATIEAGASGPKLEADLESRGFSLGHHPDSFEFSTLGGWIATRSVGMQSDAYGRIEDMLVGLKLVSPLGVLETRNGTFTSAGPDLNGVVLGSEGLYGIITEATVRVHPVPEVKDYRGFLLPNFETGVAAIRACIEAGARPSMLRLQDEGETELAMQMKSPVPGLSGWIQAGVKGVLRRTGYSRPCILIVGFEGSRESVADTRRRALAILKRHRAFPLGSGVGRTWSKDKYNLPYLRDTIMNHGTIVDVAETGAKWKDVLPLYRETVRVISEKLTAAGVPGFYLGCHISHTYETAACLYFTFACKQTEADGLNQYYAVKNLFTETFQRMGGTLSHHHAVGTEHRKYYPREVGGTGVRVVSGIKAVFDPGRNLNSGKVWPNPDSGS